MRLRPLAPHKIMQADRPRNLAPGHAAERRFGVLRPSEPVTVFNWSRIVSVNVSPVLWQCLSGLWRNASADMPFGSLYRQRCAPGWVR